MSVHVRLILILGIWGAASVAAQNEDEYLAPVLAEIPFDPANLKVADDEARSWIRDACHVLVCNIVMPKETQGKMMAIALGLQPDHQEAKVTNAILIQGGRPGNITLRGPENRQIPDQVVYKSLHNHLYAMRDKVKNDDEKMFVAMLFDALADIEKRKDFHDARNLFRRMNNAAVPWDVILAKGGGSGKREGNLVLKSKQEGINALLVMELGNTGAMAGQVSRLTSTFLANGQGNHNRGLRFNQSVGRLMRQSLPEVAKFMEVRHDDWIGKGIIEFAFQEKVSPKDGDSAGLACGLLTEALISGVEFDERFACTGVLNVDGSVQPIGGVVAKLRGARKGGCELVAIPYGNRYALTDLTVLGEAGVLATTQVFVVSDFKEALALAMAKREKGLAGAIAQFGELQAQFREDGVMRVLRTKEAQAALEEILKAAPNHASARLMLSAVRKSIPKRLSLNGSLEELFALFAESAQLVTPPPGLIPLKSRPVSDFDSLQKALKKLAPKLEPRTEGTAQALARILSACIEYRKHPGNNRTELLAKHKVITAAFEKLSREVEKLENDPELIEDLLKQ